MNIPFNRARRTLSGTQNFIVGTRDWANRFEKNSNQSLTSLTFNTSNYLIIRKIFKCFLNTFI